MDPQCHSFLHFILKPTKKEIGKGTESAQDLAGPEHDTCPCMTRQGVFSKGYTKSYRKKESRSKALRVICEVGL